MRRYGTVYRDRVEFDFWAVFSRDPVSVRVLAGYPSLGRNERAMNLKVVLPNALFETPSLSASISVAAPEHAPTIDIAGVAEAMRQAIGMDVEITVKDPDP
jgi:hypothetical protein